MSDITATLEQARNGDTGAFAQIVRQYQSLVSGVLFSATGDFHKSEDFTQETFLIAWQKLGELRNSDHLAAWLCTIARNLVHRSHRKPSIATEPLAEETGGGSPAALVSANPAPDAELLRREQSDFVWSAIGEIEEQYRETLILYYRSGQSVREIAAATELTEEAVRQRLVRARKSLKAKLEEMVGSILTDTAPGELFTMTVMTALGAAMLTTTAQAAVAGTAAGTGAAGKATGTALGTATIWSFLAPAVFWGWFIACFIGVFWASVRNTPTLRARRCRVHAIFWGLQHYCLFTVVICVGVGIFTYLIAIPFLPAVAFIFMFASILLITIPMQTAHLRKLKRIVENDLGLPGERVESYSYQQVERRFFLSLITNLLFAETILTFFIGATLSDGSYSDPKFLLMVLGFVAVVIIITVAYYPLGRYFLEICRRKENFLSAPPLIDNPLETVLMKSGKNIASVDSLKKAGKMKGFLLLTWIGLTGVGLWYFSHYSWDKHPVPLGICAILLIAFFIVPSLLAKRVNNMKVTPLLNILFFFGIAGLMVVLECIEFGNFDFWAAWVHFNTQPSNYDVRPMHRFIFLVALIQIPVQLFYWRKAMYEESDDKQSGRDALLREAIARFDPATMIADELEVAAQPFPRRWIWIIGLYAAAIVVMYCVAMMAIH